MVGFNEKLNTIMLLITTYILVCS